MEYGEDTGGTALYDFLWNAQVRRHSWKRSFAVSENASREEADFSAYSEEMIIKKELAEKLRRISERYCDQLYFTPSSASDESRRIVFETAFRKADFGDFVLVLGNRDAGAVREAARQVAYELDLY